MGIEDTAQSTKSSRRRATTPSREGANETQRTSYDCLGWLLGGYSYGLRGEPCPYNSDDHARHHFFREQVIDLRSLWHIAGTSAIRPLSFRRPTLGVSTSSLWEYNGGGIALLP